MFLPVVGQGFVELSVLFGRDVVRVARPDGLCFVEDFVFAVFLLDGLLLFLVTFVLVVIVLTQILDLGFVFLHGLLAVRFLLFFLFLVIADFLLAFLLNLVRKNGFA